MAQYGNMGPFAPTSFKGNARVNGVPMFVDKLPLTQGGIAGESLHFGRVVSINPANRRSFVEGCPAGNIPKGIVMLDPTIMRADPAQQDYYFAGRPCTIVTVGILDILEYDTTKDAPMEGSTVWFKNDSGLLAFNNGTDISGSGYTKLNAYVYESLDPNGAKVAFGLPGFTVSQTRESVDTVVEPTATPAAGEVDAGTPVELSSETEDATIYYTLDGTTPDMSSPVYTVPIVVTAAVTIKAIAVKEGMDPSDVLTSEYTIS